MLMWHNLKGLNIAVFYSHVLSVQLLLTFSFSWSDVGENWYYVSQLTKGYYCVANIYQFQENFRWINIFYTNIHIPEVRALNYIGYMNIMFLLLLVYPG